MNRASLGTLALLLISAPLAGAGSRIQLVARDLEERPVAGIRFTYGGVESLATNRAGATELDLPPDHPPGRSIKVFLIPNPKQADAWFLVNPQINIPSGSAPAEVILMRRSTFRNLAAEARDASRQTALGPVELTAEDRKRVLTEAAARHGLSADQLDTALRSFAEAQDPRDRGIAAYLEGQYSEAENLLGKAAERKESDFVETLRYLGASQYEQAKYRAAADTFLKAVALRGEDADLLSSLGTTLYELAEWPEAEALLRRALAIDEETFGPEASRIASHLSNLAALLLATNRLAEGEPLMRRALAIGEASCGSEHPRVAIYLNNLAQLLKDTSRLREAEPLIRRALAIDEKCLDPEHPRVAKRLNNLALLLMDSNRLVEAEPLLRRALAIDQKNFGAENPNVARDLNNLAHLLQATNRPAEAEPLMRLALSIDEHNFGAEHPRIATELNNLAQLLQATNRLAEAEPLMRRALSIAEKGFGPEHPNLATELTNLANLLQTTKRFAEAEPLMRRALANVLAFKQRTGHEHPDLSQILGHYYCLLMEMGKSDDEIQATILAMVRCQE